MRNIKTIICAAVIIACTSVFSENAQAQCGSFAVYSSPSTCQSSYYPTTSSYRCSGATYSNHSNYNTYSNVVTTQLPRPSYAAPVVSNSKPIVSANQTVIPTTTFRPSYTPYFSQGNSFAPYSAPRCTSGNCQYR